MNRDVQRIIKNMCYTEFIALLQETNRCPGGKRTVRIIRELLHIDRNTKLLEVGSNTGFTSFEFAHISPSIIYGIDVSEECIRVANKVKLSDIISVRDRISFQVASSYSIPFSSENFDIVMAGGATGFMDDKATALQEYFRVLKNWGFLVLTPLIYHTKPPQKILDSVSQIIGTKIQPMTLHDWQSIVTKENSLWELYHQESHRLTPRENDDIDTYISHFMKKEHIKQLSDDVQSAILKRWRSHISIFNENHKYLGYAIQIYRKRKYEEEPELFIES